MKIICRSNCSGKTKELIKESLSTDIPILTLTPRKENSLKEKSIAYFGEVVNTLPLEDAKDYSGNVLIDDIDKILPDLLKIATGNNNISVECITLSA